MNALEADLRQGNKQDAQRMRTQPRVSAVLFVDTDGATILMHEEGTTRQESSQVVQRGSGESSDSLALRTSELVRGRLLGGADAPEPRHEPKRRDGVFSRRFSFTTGPALFLRTFAAPAPGWGGDAAVWFGRFGIGPFLSGALTRATWNATSDEVTFGQLRAGVAGRALVFRSPGQLWEGQALVRLGLEPLSLRGIAGSQSESFEGNALFFTADAGLEASYRLTSWLRLGAQIVGGFDAPSRWPQTVEGKDLPEPAQGNRGGEAAPRPRTQGHLSPSAVLSAHF